MRTLYSVGAFLLILATGSASALRAQTTLATITGQVTDANGAVVPAVKIEAD